MPASAVGQDAPPADCRLFARVRRAAPEAHDDERRDGNQNAMHEAENEKIQRQAMPQANDDHIQHDAQTSPAWPRSRSDIDSGVNR